MYRIQKAGIAEMPPATAASHFLLSTKTPTMPASADSGTPAIIASLPRMATGLLQPNWPTVTTTNDATATAKRAVDIFPKIMPCPR